VEFWGFAEKHYLRCIQALPQLAARFDVPQLITRYRLDDANSASHDMGAGLLTRPVFDLNEQ
jgi:hypothetical protein